MLWDLCTKNTKSLILSFLIKIVPNRNSVTDRIYRKGEGMSRFLSSAVYLCILCFYAAVVGAIQQQRHVSLVDGIRHGEELANIHDPTLEHSKKVFGQGGNIVVSDIVVGTK
jgi:hypothetical protein